MEVRLLTGTTECWRIMQGIGDGQTVPSDGLYQVPREDQVLPVREFVWQRDLPFFKGHAILALVLFCRTKVLLPDTF